MTNLKPLFEFSIKDGSTEHKFALMKPNRALKEEGEAYHLQVLGRLIEKGVLPRIVWANIVENNGGTISKPEEKAANETLEEYLKIISKERDLKSKVDKTPEEVVELEKLGEEARLLEKKISAFQLKQLSIWENTAEAKARSKELMWWVATIAAKKEGDQWTYFAKGDDVEDRLDVIDEIYDLEDAFKLKVLNFFYRLVAAWYVSGFKKAEQFASVLEAVEKEYQESNG